MITHRGEDLSKALTLSLSSKAYISVRNSYPSHQAVTVGCAS